MPSIQAKFFQFVLKHRHLFRLQLRRRDIFDFDTSVQDFRDDCEKGARMLGKLPEGIEVTPVKINNIPAEWIMPAGGGKSKVIFYTHGGGYVSGSCADHRSIVARIVKQTQIGALLFEYRLAPEHPFPAAIDDSVTAYKWLIEQGTAPSQIVIAGESAGGGLALATLLALKEYCIPLPVAAVAVSPWTDLTCSGESYKTKNKVSLAPLNSWTVFSKYYSGENEPSLPLISPLYGNLKGLPPILIVAGEDDELLDDSISFAQKAKEAEIEITLKLGIRMVHCYPLLPAFIPEARQAFDEICKFITAHICSLENSEAKPF